VFRFDYGGSVRTRRATSPTRPNVLVVSPIAFASSEAQRQPTVCGSAMARNSPLPSWVLSSPYPWRIPMFKYVIVLLLGATSLAQSQSASPLSADNRANITAATHCKDKSGQVWLKSSAELAGQTSNASGSTTANTAGGPDLSSVAATLPECPDRSGSQTTGRTPAASPTTTSSSAGAQSSDTSGVAPSTKTPSGLTPD
jgi:hypothetical protein